MPTEYKPPLSYPGVIRRAIVRNRVGILLTALPALVPFATMIADRVALARSPDPPMFTYIALFATLGVLTAIPTRAILRKLPDHDLDQHLVLLFCCVFPIWSIPVSLLGLVLFAPLTCTAVWAAWLGMTLGKRRALHLAVLLSIPAYAGTCIVWLFFPYVLGPAVAPAVLIWQLLYPSALAISTELRLGDLEHMRTRCHTCGYPRQALAPDAPCPECGLA